MHIDTICLYVYIIFTESFNQSFKCICFHLKWLPSSPCVDLCSIFNQLPIKDIFNTVMNILANMPLNP